jgi:hypothetical protein
MATAQQLSENSRQGFDLENAACIGLASELNRNTRWGCGHAYDETVVGIAVYVRNDPVNLVDPDGRDPFYINGGTVWAPYWDSLSAILYGNSSRVAFSHDPTQSYNAAVAIGLYTGWIGATSWNAVMGAPPVPSSGFVHVSNPSKTGAQQDRISTVLNWIGANIDGDCAKWLSGIQNMIPQVLGNPANPDSVAIGHGDFQGNIAAFTNNNANQTDLPAGYAMVVNNSGGFFNSAWTVAGYSGGSSQAQVFILLHEFAHLLDAAGFQADFGSQGAVNSNDKLVQQNCAKTIKAARNIP